MISGQRVVSSMVRRSVEREHLGLGPVHEVVGPVGVASRSRTGTIRVPASTKEAQDRAPH